MCSFLGRGSTVARRDGPHAGERCGAALGDDRFKMLAAQGEAMTHEELMDLVGAGDL